MITRSVTSKNHAVLALLACRGRSLSQHASSTSKEQHRRHSTVQCFFEEKQLLTRERRSYLRVEWASSVGSTAVQNSVLVLYTDHTNLCHTTPWLSAAGSWPRLTSDSGFICVWMCFRVQVCGRFHGNHWELEFLDTRYMIGESLKV